MTKVEKVLQQASELSMAEQLHVYLEFHRRLEDDLDQLDFLKCNEDAFKDWDNQEDNGYNDLY